MMDYTFQSWGRYPKVKQMSRPIYWRSQDAPANSENHSILPYGMGRSYGDVCLNENGIIINTRALDRFISFDKEGGFLRCEAGVSLDEIIRLIVPHGWFLPVTPGTKFVTIGGAIANDVHGKNHHKAGSFGCFVKRFELLRSNGDRYICSPESHAEYFLATIGGMGLTGLITWAEIKLHPIHNDKIKVKTIKFSRLDEFFNLSDRLSEKYPYTVAWIDCLASGDSLGRGLYMAGDHASEKHGTELNPPQPPGLLAVPFDLPEFVLNKYSLKLFNNLIYNKQMKTETTKLVDFNSFFYPLDSINEWNRIYGKRGLLQYQCLLPLDKKSEIRKILELISDSGQGSFLAVLKIMGDIASPGMLSFSRAGITLALDFPVNDAVLKLFKKLDRIVRGCGGRLYSAKDACMSADDFQAYYPNWKKFSEYIDSAYSSSFWRRVTGKSE